jgi:curli production assembly/transport component CsgG
MSKQILIFGAVFLAMHLLGGCTAAIQPLSSSKAVVGYRSQVYDDLVSLPPPKEPIVITVYKFRDQTGQFKSAQDTSVQYSTAVTQGATSMLIKALQDAGGGRWFKVVEREGLANLLNERKIIRQTRAQYKGGDDLPALPPLVYAPLILEGGIIAYETNLLTGGLGARYFGAGGSTEYRRDNVTVYLRAVSVKNGQTLKSVNTSKTIFSAAIEGGLFRFVSFQRLLEAEFGISSNEPPQMAVLEAIEMSVYSLIMEGMRDGLWSFADPVVGRRVFNKYQQNKKDRYITADFDEQGNLIHVLPASDALKN